MLFDVLQFKIFVRQSGDGQLGGPGGNALKGVIPKGPAVGAGGHDSLFGTDHLAGVQLPPPGAVGTTGFDRCLEQVYGGSAPSRFRMKRLYYIPPSFSTIFLYHIHGKGQEGQPHPPSGGCGDGKGPVEIQLGNGLGLFRQVEGRRGAHREATE